MNTNISKISTYVNGSIDHQYIGYHFEKANDDAQHKYQREQIFAAGIIWIFQDVLLFGQYVEKNDKQWKWCDLCGASVDRRFQLIDRKNDISGKNKKREKKEITGKKWIMKNALTNWLAL